MFKLFSKKHTKDGLEVPDPTPISVPLTSRPLTLAEQIARFTRDETRQHILMRSGMDTFDEADDFEIDSDEVDKAAPYEVEFNGKELPLAGVQTRLDEQRSGMVEEMPVERFERANERVRGLGKPKPAPQPAPAQAQAGAAADASAQKP